MKSEQRLLVLTLFYIYCSDCRRIDRMVSQAVDDSVAQKLWELSCDLVKLEDDLRI